MIAERHVPRGWTEEDFQSAVDAAGEGWPEPTAEQHAEIKRLFTVVPPADLGASA